MVNKDVLMEGLKAKSCYGWSCNECPIGKLPMSKRCSIKNFTPMTLRHRVIRKLSDWANAQETEVSDFTHELFPMFQLRGNEGIEDVVNRIVPELINWRERKSGGD